MGATGDRRAVRAAARRRRARRGAVIAAVSSLVVFGGLTTALLLSPGWPQVHRLFFNWHELVTSFRGTDTVPSVVVSFWQDIKAFCVVEVVVLVLGLLVALARTTRSAALFPMRVAAVLYVDVFRGVPTILVVYLFGFGLPALNISWLPNDPWILGGFGLSLSYGAYVSEVYRAGIVSVHQSQRAAARALGLSPAQTMRHVVLPQAVRRVLPPLLNDFVSLQKDVALVSILGPQEAFRVAGIFQAADFNYTPIMGAAMLYVAVTIPFALLLDRIQARHVLARSTGGLA